MWFVVKLAVSAWLEHRAASKGAALAYYTLFSIAPMLVLVLAIAGLFYGRQAAQGELSNQLQHLVGKSGAEAIQTLLASASNPADGTLATMIAIVLLLVGTTSVFSELKESLDDIWQVARPAHLQPGWVSVLRTRLLSFGLVLVLALLLMVSLVMSAALALVERYFGGYWLDVSLFLTPLSAMVGFAVSATLFAVIYKILPSIRLSWGDVWIGALATAGLFALGKYVIGLYIGRSGVTSSFGAAGSLVAVMLWVYYSAQIFLLGAEFTHQYAVCFGSLQPQAVVVETGDDIS